MHWLNWKETNQWPTLSKFQNIAGVFWAKFLLEAACISKGDFLSTAGMCLGGVAVAIETISFIKSEMKRYYWKLLKNGTEFSYL